MNLTQREARSFDAIAARVGDPERRREQRGVAWLAGVVVTLFALAMLGLGWGWEPVAGFVPGVAVGTAVLQRRLSRGTVPLELGEED